MAPSFVARALKIWALMSHTETATIGPGKPWRERPRGAPTHLPATPEK
jgi:hypothetical protein